MVKKAIKIKQIEPLLSEKIQAVYQAQLEHPLHKISYKLFDNTLVITMEGTITSPEKLLKDNERFALAKQVREAIDSVIRPQIQSVIEEVLDVKIVDFLSDTTIEHDMTGAIAIFELESN